MDKDIQNNEKKGERIAKVMARAGLCSRREAERWIEAGRVTVNGKKLETPACVVTDADEIMVDKKRVGAAAETRLFLHHKPAGLVTTNKDEQARATVFDRLPEDIPRVVSVGRLDMSTEGLLLLTNDGGLSRYLELPATGWKRKYRVRVHGHVSERRLQKLRDGITVEGVEYRPIEVEVDTQEESQKGGTNSWLTVALTEGKNREIRKLMEAIDLQVSRLIRTSYGPFNLGKMARGSVQEVKSSVLRDQIKGYFKKS